MRSSARTPSARNGHLFAAILVLVISLPLALYSPLSAPAELRGGSDFAINRAIQQSYANPSLYQQDYDVQAMREGYLPRYSRTMVALLQLGNPLATYFTLSILLWLAFLAGMYCLTFQFTRSIPVAAIAAASVAFGHHAFNGMLWGIQLGQVLPRDLFTALTPWTLLFFVRYEKPYARMALFFALGLLANIHVLEACYLIGFLFLIALLTLVAKREPELHKRELPKQAVRNWLLPAWYGIAALIPALPTLLSTAKPIAIEALLRYRMPYLFTLNLPQVAWWLLVPAVLAVFGWCAMPALRENAKRWLFAGAMLSIGGHLIAQVIPSMLLLQFARAGRLLYLPLLILAAAGCWQLITQKRWWAVAGIGLLIVPLPLVLSPFVALPSAAVGDAAEQQKDRAVGITPREVSADFLNVADWAKTQTPTDTLFLVPPVGFSVWFRAIAERSVVVDQKDGSNMIITQQDGGQGWYQRYVDVRSAYLQNQDQTSAFTNLALRYGATHIIAANDRQMLDLPIAFRNAAFTVYAVPNG